MNNKKQSEIQATYLYNLIEDVINEFCLAHQPVDLASILSALCTHKGHKLAVVPDSLRSDLRAKLNNLEELAFQEALSKYGGKVAKPLNNKGDVIQ